MSSELTVPQRIDLIEQLQAQEQVSRRNAVRRAWLSVAFATAVLGLVVLAAALIVWNARVQLADLQTKRDNVAGELQKTEQQKERVATDLARARTELQQKQAALAETKAQLAGTLGNVPEKERRAAIEKQFNLDPKAALLLPRAYVQIVDPSDRPWATEVSRFVEKAGIIVPGIEYVPKAAGLKHTDVRYYKEGEKQGAEEIISILKTAGVTADLNYLHQDNNTNVRPKHYEIWFAAGSHHTPLTGATAPAAALAN